MIWPLLWFEIKNRLGSLSAIIYFAVFFSLSFLLAISFAGAFNGVVVSFGLSNKLALNSSVVLYNLTSSIGYLGLLIIAPIFGGSINQDFETGFHQILFATPIRKSTYFFIRYLASFIACLSILLSIGLGFFLATIMPFVDRTMVEENHILFYIVPYFSNLIPNILIFGALFIAVIAIFKKMAPIYVASVCIFTGLMISLRLTGDLESKLAAALADPLGGTAFQQIIRYWSVSEQAMQIVPLVGCLLYNRLLWLAVGTSFLAFAYLSFNPFRLPKEKKKCKTEKTNRNELKFSELKAFKIKLLPRSWKVFYQLSLSEFKQAFSNIYFLVILLCGILFIFATSSFIGKFLGTEVMPVTYHVLEAIGGTFYLFVIIITAYYAGELVWKDRDQNVYELIDSKPVRDLFLYFSKLLSLFFIQIFLAFIVFACCLLIQIFKGYYHFELGVYVQHLLFTLPSWFLSSVFALFIHVLSRNKYVGHSIIVFYFVLLPYLSSLGLGHHLYLMGLLPTAQYSDMNGFGTSLLPFTAFSLYWSFFYICLAVITILFWPRGRILTWKDRLAEFRFRIKPVHKKILAISLSAFLALGSFIYYNTNVLNIYKTTADHELELVDYEHKFKHFEKIPQPDIVSVNVQVDLFPKSQSMNGKGVFKYRNTSSLPIKTLLLNISQKSEVIDLSWNKSAHLTEFNPRLGVRIYDFDQPIQPNEEIELQFTLGVTPKGFENEEFSKKIVENGTFFHGFDFFPVVGYQSRGEIPDDAIRRKYNLPEKPRMPDLNDTESIKKTYVSNEGTWIDFEATISTSLDQTAIAPGYLEKEWIENGRHYFTYKTDKPILNYYAFLSGRYEVVYDQWNDVKIEIYHHPGHTRNIPRMICSIKKSLDYYTKNFSPYQFKQVRIIEFPRYAMFAEAFPNTIPYSEGLGFIARVRANDPENIDYPFYVTAHEMAHQWWAHQVIGGMVQGATMLSESLAQYSALMVMEKEFGPQQIKKFLKYELDQYLNGRSCETKKELPLMLNENQPYIHYNKGSLVFYALKDYLGETAVNQVLQDYIQDMAFQKPPFTRSIDLVNRFKEIAPLDKKYLIEDLFETITFYDNRTDSVSFKKTPNGKYEVEIRSTNKKLRADELGAEQEIPMDDYVDVGIFDKKGHIAYLQKHKIKNGENVFRIEVGSEPSKGGIDPLNKLIDKVSDNHIMKASELN
ncbi:MAG: ABC transporter permease [Chlamydiae bacterium]|nr:ABC transporter permease [Chlamydiota bacterium]